MAGILYVVFNKWVNNPETKERPYKIGITKGTVEDRYYGLGLKMPGEFETLFAYSLNDYQQAETFFHNLFKQYHNNGEWFDLDQKQLDLLKSNCEAMGGIDVKDKIKINEEPIKKSGSGTRRGNTGAATLPEGDIFGDAIQELNTIAVFLGGKGFNFKVRQTPFGNEFYSTYVVVDKPAHGVGIVLSIFPKKTQGERYRFKYETRHEFEYNLKEKQKRIEAGHPGLSVFRPGKNDRTGKIEIMLKGKDPGNEILEVIEKTRGIIGY